MNASLWLLIRLQLRGWFRHFGRSLGTVKGILLALVTGFVILIWIGSLFVGPRTSNVEPDNILLYGPAVVLAYCVMNVLLTTGERTIYFTPAEVNFLFSGPFSRRQILLYKIASTLLIGSPTPFLMTLFLRQYGPTIWGVFLGLMLLYVFMTLFSMALNLAAVGVGAKLYSRTRKIAGVLLLVGLVGLVVVRGELPQGDLGAWAEGLLRSCPMQVLLAPLKPFFGVFLADSFGFGLLLDVVLALTLNGAVLLVVVFLDADYLETAANSSAIIYEKIRQIRGGNFVGGSTSVGLPNFPHWAGVGPIFWRQMLTAIRGIGRLLLVGFILVVVAGSFFLGSLEDGGSRTMLFALGGMMLWITIFITVLVPFDFRGDIDRIAMLKTLPISPWLLALGQVLTPTILLTLIHWLLLLGFGLFPKLIGGAAFAEPSVFVRVGLFSLPFNFFLFGLENLLFLFFPIRLMGASPGDFQTAGRNIVLMMGKLIGLGFVAGVAAVVGFIAYWVHMQSLFWGLLAGWVVLACAGGAMLPVIGYAFRKFDVGRDTPA